MTAKIYSSTPGMVFVSNRGMVAMSAQVKKSKGRVVIGQNATHKAIAEGETQSLVMHIKQKLGSTIDREKFRANYNKWFDGSPWLDPEDAAACILSYVKEKAIRQIKSYASSKDLFVRRVVIGVPSRATQSYRLSLIKASDIAGFEEVLLVPEPIAAFWALSKTISSKELKRVLIVDIGSGTTDLSLMDIGPNEPEILLTAGELQCGGTAVDNQIIRYLGNKYPSIDASLNNFGNWEEICGFKEKVNSYAELNLMEKYSKSLVLDKKNGDLKEQITLKGSEAHDCARVVARRFGPLFKDLLERGIQNNLPAELRDCKINDVLLVGGACRTRAFLEKLVSIVNNEYASCFDLKEPLKVEKIGLRARDSYLTRISRLKK